MPVFPAPGNPRQKDLKFKANLGYMERPHLTRGIVRGGKQRTFPCCGQREMFITRKKKKISRIASREDREKGSMSQRMQTSSSSWKCMESCLEPPRRNAILLT
jgi:hypothetical protein